MCGSRVCVDLYKKSLFIHTRYGILLYWVFKFRDTFNIIRVEHGTETSYINSEIHLTINVKNDTVTSYIFQILVRFSVEEFGQSNFKIIFRYHFCALDLTLYSVDLCLQSDRSAH